MDPAPQIPPVTVDEAGTIRVGGRFPMGPYLARERACWLMARVQDCGGQGEITHPHFGAMSCAAAVMLANELWAESWRPVAALVLPAPAGESA
jgi:hypothetical protein